MTWWELVLVGLAGGGAGLINAVVGSGTLITFPTLLAFGMPPVLANVSNSIGLAPGSLSACSASRPDLVGQRKRIIRYGIASLLGSVGRRVAAAAVAARGVPDHRAGPDRARLPAGDHRALAEPPGRRAPGAADGAPGRGRSGSAVAVLAIIGTGMYGGYFGAAQGVLVLAIMGVALSETLPRINGLKNVLVMIANAVAGVVFVIVSEVDWWVVLALAIGSVLGAQVGARVGRRLPPLVYRGRDRRGRRRRDHQPAALVGWGRLDGEVEDLGSR